jgi:hypothetical protein
LTKIDIVLDKKTYYPGEKVKGIVKLMHGEHFWERSEDAKLYLAANGIEKTTVVEKVLVDVIDPNTGKPVTDPNTGQPVKREEKVLVDVIDPNTGKPVTDPNTGQPVKREEYETRSQSHTFFNRSLSSQIQSLGSPLGDGYVKIDKGTKEASFEFTLSEESGELFQSYDGKSILVSYSMTGLVDKKSVLRIDARTNIPFSVFKKPVTEGPSNKINVTSESEFLRLNLEAEKDLCARGDLLKGKVTLNNPSKKSVARLEVGIRSIEKAVADGVLSETFGTSHMQGLAGTWSSGDSRTFELKIPSELTPSFQGINAEYRWELTARVDSAGSLAEDLFTVHRITIT